MKFKHLKIGFVLTVIFSCSLFAHEAKNFPLNLLFSKEDIPRIRENTQLPIFKEYWQSLLDADFEKDGNFMHEAFIYAITGDRARGKNAKQGMLNTLKLKRWDYFLEDGQHTLGFLQGGRTTAWMSLSYDWIYDLLSPEERKEVLRQIAEQGCVPCFRALYGMRYPESVKGWSFDPERNFPIEVPDMSRWPVILGNNNFRAVISGGFALGLFALEGKDDRFDKWFEMLMDSFYRFVNIYAPDGSYDEGVSYCNYASTYLIYFMEIMKRKRGIELFDAGNFVGMMDCNLALFFPHHLNPTGSVNFGDSGRSMNSSNAFWVARKSRDGLTQYQALNFPSGHDIFSLVFYDPTVKPVAPNESLYFKKLDLDWIVTRTGYGMNDLVVAMRSGPPANHEHADRNSVILKYFGEILLADQKRPTYDPKHPEWFLRTSPAHNTILIDNRGHQYHNGEEGTNASKASAKITRMGERSGYVFWSSDATPAYQLVDNDVKSITRTVLVFREIPFLLVLDKMMKSSKPSLFSSRWIPENSDKKGKVESQNQSFLISRPNAKFYGVCAGTPNVMSQSAKLPLPDSVGVYSFVNVEAREKSQEAFFIVAGCPLQLSEESPEILIENKEETWFINLKKNGKSVKLKVFDQNEVPEFEIVDIKNK